ncbi:MAG: hypothetical protein ACYC96_14505 [Fimbriimonadaceae bacterium]
MSAQFTLFGRRRKTQVLELLALLEESQVLELARLLSVPAKTVQGIAEGIEQQGLIEGRLVGRARRLTFNRRFPEIDELRVVLVELGSRDAEVAAAVNSLRRGPRAKGKALQLDPIGPEDDLTTVAFKVARFRSQARKVSAES